MMVVVEERESLHGGLLFRSPGEWLSVPGEGKGREGESSRDNRS